MQNPCLLVGTRGSDGSVSLGKAPHPLLFEVNPVIVRQDSYHDIYPVGLPLRSQTCGLAVRAPSQGQEALRPHL